VSRISDEPDFSKPLPAAPESERLILGAVLRNQREDPNDDRSPLAFDKIRSELSADEFHSAHHRTAWSVLDDLWARNFKTFDYATLASELDRRSRREQRQQHPPSYWMDLTEIPDVVNLDFHVAAVKEKARYRQLIEHHHRAAKRAWDEEEAPDRLLAADLEFCQDMQSRNGIEPAPMLPQWPAPLRKEAYHGVAGELVRLIEPHTEGDPAALLLQFLAAWGSMIGRGAYYLVEGDYHHTNLYVVIVGATSKGRKGTSWGRVRVVLAEIDEHWTDNCIVKGLGSGEGLIDWLARENADKRCLIHDAELARILAVVSREGTTLSPVIRDAYDNGSLSIHTRQHKVSVKGAHVSLIAHVTRDELRRRLNDVEIANGFANRMLWVCAARSKELPEGGGSPDLGPVIRRIASATQFARRLGSTRVQMDQAAKQLWRELYHELSSARPGLLGEVTNRLEANTIRVSLNYALLDESEKICEQHLRAGLAVVSAYCFNSARFIWGDSLGDPTADQSLKLIRDASANGLTRTDLIRAFSGHKSSAELDRAVGVLSERGLIRSVSMETPGRPESRYFAL
jgi:hypothetical protein